MVVVKVLIWWICKEYSEYYQAVWAVSCYSMSVVKTVVSLFLKLFVKDLFIIVVSESIMPTCDVQEESVGTIMEVLKMSVGSHWSVSSREWGFTEGSFEVVCDFYLPLCCKEITRFCIQLHLPQSKFLSFSKLLSLFSKLWWKACNINHLKMNSVVTLAMLYNNHLYLVPNIFITLKESLHLLTCRTPSFLLKTLILFS